MFIYTLTEISAGDELTYNYRVVKQKSSPVFSGSHSFFCSEPETGCLNDWKPREPYPMALDSFFSCVEMIVDRLPGVYLVSRTEDYQGENRLFCMFSNSILGALISDGCVCVVGRFVVDEKLFFVALLPGQDAVVVIDDEESQEGSCHAVSFFARFAVWLLLLLY